MFAQLLGKSGHDVSALCTTQTEHHQGFIKHEEYLKNIPDIDHEKHSFFLLSPDFSIRFMKASLDRDELVDHYLTEIKSQLENFCPDFLFTYGNTHIDKIIRMLAKQAEVKVIFALHNRSYNNAELSDVDHYITPSHYLRSYYSGLTTKSTCVYPPMDWNNILSDTDTDERLFLTFVNPVFEKGLLVVVALLESLLVSRPDIPILIVEGRGNANIFLQAAIQSGIDINRYENLYISTEPMSPKGIMQHTRVLIVPSIIEEAAGRVAMEAMINGIPALVSNKGGLPEIVKDTELVLPLPKEATIEMRKPLKSKDTDNWIRKIERLFDEPLYYSEISKSAKNLAKEHYAEQKTLSVLQALFQEIP